MRLKVLLLGGAVGILAVAATAPLQAETIQYTYDVHGRLVLVKHVGTAQTAYSYDPADNRSQKITALPGAPVAGLDYVNTAKNTAVTFDPRINDADGDGDSLTVTGKTNGAHGTVSYTSSSLTFTPTTGYTGDDTFTYTISDGTNTATGDVKVTVASSNSPPNAGPDKIVAITSTAKTFDPRANDSDPDSDTLTITGKTDGGHGTVSYTGTSLTYTPTTSYEGQDSFTYTISDGNGGSATTTVVATVAASEGPVATADSLAVNRNVASTFDPRSNDSDPNGDPLTITAKTDGSHGAVVINSGTSVTYTPTSGYSGSDSFTYTVSDGSNTAVGTVTVTVAANVAPVASPDTLAVTYNTSATFDPRSNDSDLNGDSLTISAKTDGAHGTVVINSGVSVTYTPTSGYLGADSFSYTVADGNGGTDTETVTVSVSSSNSAPVAVADSITTSLNAAKTFDPRTNDTDAESNALTVVSKTDGAHGTVAINSGATLTYTPTTSYYGSDSFTYTITDGMGGGDSTATVNVTVSSSTNSAPTATNDGMTAILYYGGGPGHPTGTAYPLGNDTDPDSDTLTIISVTQPLGGTVTYTSTSVTYEYGSNVTPNGTAEIVDSDEFTYTISDGNGHTSTATIVVSVEKF